MHLEYPQSTYRMWAVSFRLVNYQAIVLPFSRGGGETSLGREGGTPSSLALVDVRKKGRKTSNSQHRHKRQMNQGPSQPEIGYRMRANEERVRPRQCQPVLKCRDVSPISHLATANQLNS